MVLATGNSDWPNRLGVRGECLPGIVHSHANFAQLVKQVCTSVVCVCVAYVCVCTTYKLYVLVFQCIQ